MADVQVSDPGPVAAELPTHRILIVDDRADLRELLRTRFQFESDIEVVGEASNGKEAVRLTRALAPSAVVLDLEMPVMRGDEAIPLLRAAAPGMGILLYSAATELDLPESARPDVIVRKGGPLAEVVTQLRILLLNAPFDVMRLQLGTLPLRQAIAAFDTWTGLNVRVMEALERGDDLTVDQLSGATPDELEALMGVYVHIGHNLQKAARAGLSDATPVIHVFRSSGVHARSALLAFEHQKVPMFWKAWGFDVPPAAVEALGIMRERLLAVLPTSTGDEASTGTTG